ncbi:GNAT family N-acetyltransferase [bacterium]|nr:GNAT family N-acetyltransferase [bacterium]
MFKLYKGLNDDIRHVRKTVFVCEQGFQNEFDLIDEDCFHVVFYENKKPVATCRFYNDKKIYHIGRVALLKEYRGMHLGEQIMQFAENEIKEAGGNLIEVSAQVRIKNFYKKLGYVEQGEVYLDEFCEHIKMVKNL